MVLLVATCVELIFSGSYSLDYKTHDIELKCQAVRKIVYGELWSLWFIIFEWS